MKTFSIPMMALVLLLYSPYGSSARAGDKPGDTAVLNYYYTYNGLIVKGSSNFRFTVTVIELNSNKTQALVKVTNIERHWANKGDKKYSPRETNIKSMPFQDPRAGRTYNAPPAWGKLVEIGDKTWVTRSRLDSVIGLDD